MVLNESQRFQSGVRKYGSIPLSWNVAPPSTHTVGAKSGVLENWEVPLLLLLRARFKNEGF